MCCFSQTLPSLPSPNIVLSNLVHTKSLSVSLNKPLTKSHSDVPTLTKSASLGSLPAASNPAKAFYNFYGESEPSEPSDWEGAEMNLHSLLDVEPYFDSPAEFHFGPPKPFKKKSKFFSLFSKKKSVNALGPAFLTPSTSTPKPTKMYWAKGEPTSHVGS